MYINCVALFVVVVVVVVGCCRRRRRRHHHYHDHHCHRYCCYHHYHNHHYYLNYAIIITNCILGFAAAYLATLALEAVPPEPVAIGAVLLS